MMNVANMHGGRINPVLMFGYSFKVVLFGGTYEY